MYENYNNDTPENAVSTMLFVTGAVLFKEGYKPDDVTRIMERIVSLTIGIFSGELQISNQGISKKESNVVPIDAKV